MLPPSWHRIVTPSGVDKMRAILWLFLAGWCLGAPVTAAWAAPTGVADTVGLRRKLDGAMVGYAGVVGVSVRDLRTEEALSIRDGESFRVADQSIRTGCPVGGGGGGPDAPR